MQRAVHVPIYQIVGYKNSGKTSLMVKLIDYFTQHNLEVGTFKHHGHGGEPEVVKHTDSDYHFTAGASVSFVQGEKQLHMKAKDTSDVTLDQLLALYNFFNIDLVLIEGYKRANYPKIVLIRHQDDLQLLESLSNVIAVGSHDLQLIESLDYLTFSLVEIDQELNRLANHMIST
ncbi:MAG TPA: molybdopterin-guanine dinucleotide biosynthesis protein B [Bacillota bacterium]|nr:molybdopterin-guanine dinucleotide biosynthesis protein B [Bacillota bacterium]